MRTETIIKQLEQKGFIFPTCLQWQVEDIDMRLRSIGLEDELKLMNNEDKRMLMEDFFAEESDLIIEYINQRLEEYLEASTQNNLNTQIF